MGDELKSKSGPFASAQLLLSGSRHATVHASAAVICWDHRIFPDASSMATTASLVRVGGSLKLLPVPTYSRLRVASIVGAFQMDAPDGPQSCVPVALFFV